MRPQGHRRTHGNVSDGERDHSSFGARTDLRRRYVAALRAVGNHDIEPLLVFARS